MKRGKFMSSFKMRTFATLLFLATSITPAYATVINLSVESAGRDDGNYARIFLDGTDIITATSGRGINVAVLDETTGGILNTERFDTWYSSSEATDFVNFISGLDMGRIVMVAVGDTYAKPSGEFFTSSAQFSMQSLGASFDNISDAGFRGSYGFIGIVGSGIGSQTAFEASATQFGGAVSTSDQRTLDTPPNAPVQPVNAPATLAVFGLGLMVIGLRRRI
jgi:hypothetical protein